jgi:DcuC family C4-dicarboxylate transporter
MDGSWLLLCGAVVIVLAVVAVLRGWDVRLALLLAALALGGLGRHVEAITQTFLTTLTSEQFVVPICCAMGFAHVLRHTECDQHLVRLLVKPLRRVRVLVIPGAVLVGYLVNIPVISQTSTAVAIGSVLIPLLRAADVSPVTCGATLLLGSSMGGELFNPGAPELRTIANATKQSGEQIVARVVPLNLVNFAVATCLFWALSARAERRYGKHQDPPLENAGREAVPEFRVNLFKAAVPLVPLVLLFLVGPPLDVWHVPKGWLVESDKAGPGNPYDSRLIGAAMLVGVAVAVLSTPRALPAAARAFFEGAGYAFTHIISLIVTASCFGKGIQLIGLADLIKWLIVRLPTLLLVTAGTLPLGFAVLSGSGMASTQSLFGLFAGPAQELHIDPARVGAVVSLAAAAGRTMSPVAAVTLMCATLTATNPLALARRVAVPLLVSTAVMIALGAWLAGR